MKFHACFLDRECTSIAGERIWKVHIHSDRLGHVTLGSRSQAWLPFLGTLPPTWWGRWWITYDPPHRREGWLHRRFPYIYN